MALPALRDELELFTGPVSRAGAPSWSIYDPVRNLYFRIDWPTFEILCRWPMGDPEQIAQSIESETTLSMAPDAITDVLEFLMRSDLLRRATAEDTGRLAKEHIRRQQAWYKQLVHTYLFFRVPLLRPNDWLANTLPWVRWLGSSLFLYLTLIAFLLGVFLVSHQWDSFTTSLVDLFSVQGLVAYGITLVSVKFLHELGHAYTAKNFGCRVPTMGVAFLVMFPLAYTDVNDVWRLPDKRQRLQVGAAGILTELAIAAWATLLWSVVPEGPLKTGLFLLATTTWISTIIINASPFLRFDGYFLLMDALEIPNLHQRAFNLAKWRLRELLFKLNDPQPEPFSLRALRVLQLFAVGTWLYRLIVFGGIAVLVYMTFPKPLGPILALIEIYWFIAKPVLREFGVWIERRGDIMRSVRSLTSLAVLLGFLAMFVLPWDGRIGSQALLISSDSSPIIPAQAAQIVRIPAPDGASVKAGDPLLVLSSPDLEVELAAAIEKANEFQLTLEMVELDERARGEIAILRSRLEKANAEIKGIRDQLDKLEITALVDGRVSWFDLDLKPGDWIEARTELGKVWRAGEYKVEGFIEQSELQRIALGDRAQFNDEVGRLDPIELQVTEIDTDATRVLGRPLLASVRGGQILVREAGNQLMPESAIYRVVLTPTDSIAVEALPELRGQLVIQGAAEAWSTGYYRSFMALLQRESGF